MRRQLACCIAREVQLHPLAARSLPRAHERFGRALADLKLDRHVLTVASHDAQAHLAAIEPRGVGEGVAELCRLRTLDKPPRHASERKQPRLRFGTRCETEAAAALSAIASFSLTDRGLRRNRWRRWGSGRSA